MKVSCITSEHIVDEFATNMIRLVSHTHHQLLYANEIGKAEGMCVAVHAWVRPRPAVQGIISVLPQMYTAACQQPKYCITLKTGAA